MLVPVQIPTICQLTEARHIPIAGKLGCQPAKGAGGTTMLDTTPTAKLARLLDAFDAALAAGDIGRAVDQFEDDCYWRDLVALTWNIKTLEGKDEIRAMLESQLPRMAPTGFNPAEGEEASEANGLIEGWLRFETGAARGYGHIRVRNGKIWTLLTTMVELKGFEEKAGFARPFGAKHGADKNRRTWKEEREQETAELGTSRQPYCLVVGGGQGGIALGARLRQLDVPTIIVDKHARPGDAWRKRYKSLCLHDPVWYDHLPYIDFPKNWPVFSPKDKIGDWLEMYAKVMELNYWGSTLAKKASFDAQAKEWTVVVERDGREITLKPKQLVLATGMSGKPNIPSFPGMERFKGISTTPRSIPGPTPMPARRRWSSDRTIPPMISAQPFGRRAATSPWCSGRRPISCARTR